MYGVTASKALAASGWVSAAVNTADVLDPSADTWSSATSTGLTARAYCYSFATPGDMDGAQTLVAGQSAVNDVDEYSFSGDSWSAKSNFAGNGRYGGGSYSLLGKGYTVSGYDTVASTRVTTIEEYDALADSWAVPAVTITTARSEGYWFTNSELGLGFYIGGQDNTPTTRDLNDQIDFAALTSTAKTVVTAAIYSGGSGNPGNVNTGWVFGDATDTDRVYSYNIDGAAWTTEANTSSANRKHTRGHATGSTLYNAGANAASSASDKLDVGTKTWTTISSTLSTARYVTSGVNSPIIGSEFAGESDAFAVDSSPPVISGLSLDNTPYATGFYLDAVVTTSYAYPYRTVLLAHFDGPDASTEFPEVGPSGHILVAQGDAQVDTAQAKFGSGSLLLDGTGDYVSVEQSTDWALDADFTIEFWLRLNADPGASEAAFVSYAAASPNLSWSFGYGGSDTLKFYYSTNGTSESDVSVAWSPSTATWYHLAVTRSGSDLRFFVDGTQAGSTQTVSGSLYEAATSLEIGRYTSGTPRAWNGWMDELLIVKGHARYLANFTAPTAPY